MTERKRSFVNIDELMAKVRLEQVTSFYSVELPELRRVGQEVRTKCFLACECSEETGDRALAIQVEHPATIWRCHHYGCGKGGNLVSLCNLLKGGMHCSGKPRG